MKDTPAKLTDLFPGPEGEKYLKAVWDLCDGPRAPTKSGYWFGLLTGQEKVDKRYIGKTRREIFEKGHPKL